MFYLLPFFIPFTESKNILFNLTRDLPLSSRMVGAVLSFFIVSGGFCVYTGFEDDGLLVTPVPGLVGYVAVLFTIL